MANKIKFNSNDVGDYYEPSDSEDDYTEREKSLLKKVRKGRERKVELEEEVLGFDDADSDDDLNIEKFEADSDLDGGEDDDGGLPDAKAWGSKKKSFYNTDFIDQDYSTYNEREEEIAEQEENEARAIQKQLAKQLDEADFSLDVFTTKAIDSSSNQAIEDLQTKTILKSDLSALSNREKVQLFKKDSPEFEGLVQDFTERLEESEKLLEPILSYFKDKPTLPIIEFAATRNSLILTYCTNVTFYLLLKAKRIPIKNHPIVKRLVQLRQLLIKLEDKYTTIVRPQLERFIEVLKEGREIVLIDQNKPKSKPKQKSKKLNILKNIEGNDDDESVEDETDSDEYDEESIAKRMKFDSIDDDEEHEDEGDDKMENGDDDDEQNENDDETPTTAGGDDDENEKRKITYQMAKNKGLTPHRSKEQRNPRVKHRNKFRKAIIRRKGAVRAVRTETKRYTGEMSGIKSTVRKSIKIK